MITLDDLEHSFSHKHIVTWGSHMTPATVAVSSSPVRKKHRSNKSKTSWSKEIMMFVGIMAASALAGIIFTNLHLFQAALLEDVLGIRDHAPTVIASTDASIVKIPTIVESNTNDHFYNDTNDHLKGQLASNALIFNTLPPDNRVIIEDLWVDTPIVDLHYYTPEKLEKGDFKEELERGVVRYPNTGNPEAGNMLIFGHTSDYWWNNNAFGQIFRNIPKLEEGQIIKIIWNNKMYRYKVTAKKIVKPKDVAKVYAQYHSDDMKYLTLIGCYPIGTANERIAIIAEQLPDEQPLNVVQLARNP